MDSSSSYKVLFHFCGSYDLFVSIGGIKRLQDKLIEINVSVVNFG